MAERRPYADADGGAGADPGSGSPPGTPLWVKAFGVIALALVLLMAFRFWPAGSTALVATCRGATKLPGRGSWSLRGREYAPHEPDARQACAAR
jgi:hypothetical protein